MSRTEEFFEYSAKDPKLAIAATDFRGAIGQAPLWLYLSWINIRNRYKRSVIGPFWVTVSMAVMVAALSIIYSQIFGIEIREYIPFIACGLIIWSFISGVLQASGKCFIEMESLIKQISLPIYFYAFRNIATEVIIFIHNFLVYIMVAFVFDVSFSWKMLLAIPAFILLILNGVWGVIVLGILSLRYRDVLPIIASLTQLAFLVTPVIWSSDLVKSRRFLVDVNPFYHLVEILRAPLLGKPIDPANWLITIGLALGGWILAFLCIGYTKRRMPYWL